MTTWLPCGEKFTVGDVLRWIEPDWFLKGRRKKEFFKKGERRVTATVNAVDKNYVHLEVRKCEVMSDQSARGVKVLKAGEGIKRKPATLKKHQAERMVWAGKEGEGARAVVTSRFLRS